MPVYEFQCQKCHHTFVEALSLKEFEEHLRKGFRCPRCHTRNVQQVISAQVKTSRKS